MTIGRLLLAVVALLAVAGLGFYLLGKDSSKPQAANAPAQTRVVIEQITQGDAYPQGMIPSLRLLRERQQDPVFAAAAPVKPGQPGMLSGVLYDKPLAAGNYSLDAWQQACSTAKCVQLKPPPQVCSQRFTVKPGQKRVRLVVEVTRQGCEILLRG